MRTVTIILLFFTINTYGQKSDTLFIDKYKFPLIQTKPYYNSRQKGFPSLPSEFLKTDKKEFVLNYKCLNQDVYESTTDNDGNQILVILGSTRDSTYKCNEGHFTFTNIIDTLNLKDLIFNSTTPYLKIDKKRYFLCSAKVLKLNNDTMTKCTFESINDALSIDFTFSSSSNSVDNKTKFILTDLYYKKGNTTYYLDKAFLIKIYTN